MANTKGNARKSASKTAMAMTNSASESSAAVAPGILTTPTLSNADAATVPASGLAIRPLVVQDSLLLRMPNEIKQRIYKYAVKTEEPIFPIQVVDRANKFLWSKDQLVPKDPAYPNRVKSKVVSAVPQLTVVSLSNVCKQIYDDVALTHLFYKVNEFDLRKHDDAQAITYLVAVTNERKNHIKHIRMNWCFFRLYGSHADELFNLVASLKGLKKLNIHVDLPLAFGGPPFLQKAKGFNECLNAVDGLEELEVHPGTAPAPSAPHFHVNPVNVAQTNNDAAALTALLAAHMGLDKKRGTVDLTLLRKAELTANLDVHGEGRLSNDKKPGLVSSRTRGAMRNFEQIDHNGVVPARAIPRYDLNGDLAWYVSEIKGCRETFLADDSPHSFEFLVKMAPSHASNSTEFEETWEDITVLNLEDTRWSIFTFYHNAKNSGACGRREILDIWNLRDDRDETPTKNMIAGMESIYAREAKKEVQKEAKAAKLERRRIAAEEAAKEKAEAKEAKAKAKAAKSSSNGAKTATKPSTRSVGATGLSGASGSVKVKVKTERRSS